MLLRRGVDGAADPRDDFVSGDLVERFDVAGRTAAHSCVDVEGAKLVADCDAARVVP